MVPPLLDLVARNMGQSKGATRKLIAEGRLCDAAGAPLLDPRARVPDGDSPMTVQVDGKPLVLHDSFSLFLNKPTGCVTALQDAQHPTAYELVQDAPLVGELRAVGRLDLESSGLLLWTTDGQLLHRLTHPKYAVPRTYQAALTVPVHPLPDDFTLADGHRPNITDTHMLSRADLHPSMDVPSAATAFASITIVGGAYHEVRRIFAAQGSHVLALCRVAFGRLALPGDLPAGAWRAISPGDVLTMWHS